jgi:hypothetical protein
MFQFFFELNFNIVYLISILILLRFLLKQIYIILCLHYIRTYYLFKLLSGIFEKKISS